MKVTILQENLLIALQRANRVIATKTQLPILQYVLLTVLSGNILVASTNTETTISVTAPAKTETNGGIAVPAKIFLELVSSLPKDSVLLETTEETLLIACGKVKASIPGMKSEEFPPLPVVKGNAGIDVSKETLQNALSVVLFSAATDENRPLLTGVKVEQSEEGTKFVATDGYRLSVKKMGGEKISDSSLVIPSRALLEVERICQEEKNLSTLRLTETIEGQLSFRLGDTEIITRRIEGDFPNYSRTIPTKYTTRASVDHEEFAKAVKSAAIFARDSSGIIRLEIGKDAVVVSANTPQVGENTIEIESEVEGEGGVIALNSRFLQDFLSHIQSEGLILEMTGSVNPAVFKFPNDPSFFHIIMPVRVQS